MGSAQSAAGSWAGIAADAQGRQWTPAYGALSEPVVHKGLQNYGANNCFLNVVLQAFWHMAPFRAALDASPPHKHKDGAAQACMTCALRALYTFYKFGDDRALPPDAVRIALSDLFKAQSRFKIGEMEDAAETLAAILRALHEEAVRESGALERAQAEHAASLARLQAEGADAAALARASVPLDIEDLPCEPTPCPAHACFGYQFASQLRCRGCGQVSEEMIPGREMMYYVTVSEVEELLSSTHVLEAAAVAGSSSASGSSPASQQHGRLGFKQILKNGLRGLSPPASIGYAGYGTGYGGGGGYAGGYDAMELQRSYDREAEVRAAQARRALATLNSFTANNFVVQAAMASAPFALGVGALPPAASIVASGGQAALGAILSAVAANDSAILARAESHNPHPKGSMLLKPECSNKSFLSPERFLLQHPKVFLICLVWPSGECTKTQAAACMSLMGQLLDMRQLFKLEDGDMMPVSNDEAVKNERCNVYRLRGLVVFYGKHYVCFMASEGRKQWLLMDDSRVMEQGSWADVQQKCVNARYQPTMLMYEQLPATGHLAANGQVVLAPAPAGRAAGSSASAPSTSRSSPAPAPAPAPTPAPAYTAASHGPASQQYHASHLTAAAQAQALTRSAPAPSRGGDLASPTGTHSHTYAAILVAQAQARDQAQTQAPASSRRAASAAPSDRRLSGAANASSHYAGSSGSLNNLSGSTNNMADTFSDGGSTDDGIRSAQASHRHLLPPHPASFVSGSSAAAHEAAHSAARSIVVPTTYATPGTVTRSHALQQQQVLSHPQAPTHSHVAATPPLVPIGSSPVARTPVSNAAPANPHYTTPSPASQQQHRLPAVTSPVSDLDGDFAMVSPQNAQLAQSSFQPRSPAQPEPKRDRDATPVMTTMIDNEYMLLGSVLTTAAAPGVRSVVDGQPLTAAPSTTKYVSPDRYLALPQLPHYENIEHMTQEHEAELRRAIDASMRQEALDAAARSVAAASAAAAAAVAPTPSSLTSTSTSTVTGTGTAHGRARGGSGRSALALDAAGQPWLSIGLPNPAGALPSTSTTAGSPRGRTGSPRASGSPRDFITVPYVYPYDEVARLGFPPEHFAAFNRLGLHFANGMRVTSVTQPLDSRMPSLVEMVKPGDVLVSIGLSGSDHKTSEAPLHPVSYLDFDKHLRKTVQEQAGKDKGPVLLTFKRPAPVERPGWR